jgi:hypothetical protein
MFKLMVFIFFIGCTGLAARLNDVRILSVNPGQDNFELKLQMKDGPKDSFFFVNIIKNDAESFEKLIHVVKKMGQPDGYKLDINIPSFSASPSGSYYNSVGLSFYGTSLRDPNSEKTEKKSKKK